MEESAEQQQQYQDTLGIPLSRTTAELKRSNSSPPSFSDFILVKVVFPSLDCSKVFRLNPMQITYEPLVKILTIARVADDVKKDFRLFTVDGVVILPGQSLLEFNFKEKDTLLFQPYSENGNSQGSAVATRRHSVSLAGSPTSSTANGGPPRLLGQVGARKLSSSGDINKAAMYFQASVPGTNPHLHPLIAHTTSQANLQANLQANPQANPHVNLQANTHPSSELVPNVDYWGAVSSFIGNFLKRRPSMQELPKHVLEMLDGPLIPQSHVIVACIAYLREKEAYALEGIFRLSGLATEVRSVCESFKQANFDLDWVKNPHTIATALKQYCRLANIIPTDVCSMWAQLQRASCEEKELLISIGKGFSSLKPESRFMLTCLFSFMKLVLENQETNKMAPHSLSVVWGPNLIHFQIPGVDAFSEANIQATIMFSILTHIEELKLWD